MKIDPNINTNFQPEDFETNTSPIQSPAPQISDRLEQFGGTPSVNLFSPAGDNASNQDLFAANNLVVGSQTESFGLQFAPAAPEAPPEAPAEDKPWFEDVYDWGKDALDWIGDQNMIDDGKWLGEKIWEGMQYAGEGIADGIRAVADGAQYVGEKIGDAANAVGDAIGDALDW